MCSSDLLLVDHFARVWSPAVLLFWCGLWAAWRVYAKGERRDYVFAAVAAGLGFAGNYVPVLTSIAVAVAHLARHRRLAVDRSILLYAAIVAAFIAVVLAASWHDFIRLGGYSAVLGPAVVASGSGQSLMAFYVAMAAKTDPVMIGIGAVGLVAMAFRRFWLVVVVIAVWVPDRKSTRLNSQSH